ncbi:unnamed protein product [Spirodela intermedia]|uniref:Uncharacterized protein n=1 Tax=Spirodela intermedia TaxID=51605 RepID=A0A7I8IB98_SPIIN|nr:unnamed protein product [Spirodela intermedia]CAA6654623.1 unnamed protein product [Spirodela intermedia]
MAASMILHAALFCLLAVPLRLICCVQRSRKHNLPPAPPSLPLIGNIHQFGKLPHRSLHSLAKKHGPLMYLKLGRPPTLVVSSAEMAKGILKTPDRNFCTRPNARSSPGWRQFPKISTLELFTVKRVRSLRPIREEVRVLVKGIAETASAG